MPGRKKSTTIFEDRAQLRAVAFHEAGHAVMYVLAGQELELVSIVPDDDHLGVTRLAQSDSAVDFSTGLHCALAGFIAEWVATGRLNASGARGDLEQIAREYQQYYMDPEVWYPIQWVAQALMVKQKLTGDEVSELIQKSKQWRASQDRSIARITGRTKLIN